MLLKCKAVAARAGLNSEKFDLKTFRSTYATRMLRSGFDVRTVQHWMGHKSLETTMRYLVPASDVHDRLDQVVVPKAAKGTDPEIRSTGSRRQRAHSSPRLIPLANSLSREHEPSTRKMFLDLSAILDPNLQHRSELFRS